MAGTKRDIPALVEQFVRNEREYIDKTYNEDSARTEFINPMFEALGWDVVNRGGQPEAFKDVLKSEALRTKSGIKIPDYSFRVAGVRKFLLEAKKPSVDLASDAEPAYQLRRYAWNAKLPVSVLTNFRELAIYDCRIPPRQGDSPSVARLHYDEYRTYVSHWSKISSILSRSAVLDGSVDPTSATLRDVRGVSEVDEAFLSEIELWRERLAKNIAVRNGSFSVEDLNFAVHSLIDRILFLRVSEDRGVEPYGQLAEAVRGRDVFPRLQHLFELADGRYNSGLFHFSPDPEVLESPDELTPRMKIDDEVLRDVVQRLYYPASPYEFSVLGADVLGSVYERFLGEIIRITPSHRAKVEFKPEVKKAHGVYYTPDWVVRYLVESCLGPICAKRDPGELLRVKLVDPACGSGSFLVAAFGYLIDLHTQWYIDNDPRKYPSEVQQVRRGVWRLTSPTRKKILTSSIFGVDIDPRAVEVAKLNLLLKLLEGESKDVIDRQVKLMRERALPDLGRNLKRGNSLIGTAFFRGKLDFSDDQLREVNPFDWKAAFPDIFSDGGFDVVIGNPPYFNIDDVWGKGDARLEYLKRVFPLVYNDKTDVLFYFLAKAVELSRAEVGMIVSRAFLEAYKADKLRRLLSESTHVREVIDFQNYLVFQGVGITTAVVRLTKNRAAARDCDFFSLKVDAFRPGDLKVQKKNGSLFGRLVVGQDRFGPTPWLFGDQETQQVIEAIDTAGKQLGTVLAVGKGMETGRNAVFAVPLGQTLVVGQGMQTGRNEVFGGLEREVVRAWGLRADQVFVRARNSDIQRFHVRNSGEVLLYLEDVPRFSDLPQGVQEHLSRHEKELKARAAYKRGDCDWWRYTWPLHKENIRNPRILTPYLAETNRFAFDEGCRFLGLTDTTVLYDSGQKESLRYIAALLNSKVLTFRFRFLSKLKSGGIREYFWNNISKLPIRRIDFANSTDVALHDTLVQLSTRASELAEKLEQSKTPNDQEFVRRQQTAVDEEIDATVSRLYGLTPEHVEFIERSLGKA